MKKVKQQADLNKQDREKWQMETKQIKRECEEERGLMGSSAEDSQLATARSQLRFQSAAFSSSLQTAPTNPSGSKQWSDLKKNPQKQE